MDKKSWLSNIDEKAKLKGKTINNLWEFVKFSVVGISATLIQLLLVNLLYYFLKGWKAPLGSFLNLIFTENTIGVGNNNWGYVLPFFLSNFVANVYGYLLNKHKTFRSDAPRYHFVIYFAVVACLILFATWMQGVIVNGINNSNIEWLIKLAPTIAAACAGLLQFVVLYPLQKFVLLRPRKEELVNECNEDSKE